MTLAPGSKLGPYEIIGLVGTGGMGEVYRARDPRLDRDVAIKVSNAEFTERFAREARAIAALNHTNLCHLYDVGPNYLVLEYVEGDTLKGPLSFEEALPILRQLIHGIEAAHEKNIIHRDLKPANIKITPDGGVKILDFGLAKAAEPESAADAENSPTATFGMTQAGTIIGTALYMSPEQARGKTADRRSDIWSFGVVMYELLTGTRPFGGDTIVEILGGVLNKEPDWSPLPPRAQRLVRWCLEKDRKNRMGSIGDARWVLSEPDPLVTNVEPAAARAVTAPRLAWAAAALLLVVSAVAGYGWWNATRPIDRTLIRLTADLGPDAVRALRDSVVISPDGSRIVYVGSAPGGLSRLLTRRLDHVEALPLAGTESAGVLMPFFSPDSEWIGFFANGVVKKVPAQGGAAVTLGPPTQPFGASWGDDGQIIVGALDGLKRLPAAGGAAVPLKPNAGLQALPEVLPGSRAVLFNSAPDASVTNLDDLDISVQTIPAGEVRTLIHGGYSPRYLPTSGRAGHIIYVHQGTLFGVRFDLNRLTLEGTPVPLLEDLAADASTTAGGGQFAASNSGALVYLSGKFANEGNTVQWLAADGQTTPLLSTKGQYAAPRLSPDGKRLAYTAAGNKGADIWVYDLDRESPAQITFTNPGARELAWAPDSKHLVFGDGTNLWWVRADGSSQPQKILGGVSNPRPTFLAADGRLVYSPAGASFPDIWTLPIDLSDPEHPRPGKPEPFLAEPNVVEVDPAFSPDAKFIAYASNESGGEEIYVRPFPGPGGKWKISAGGGKFPVFARTTRELYFMGGDDRIWVVSYTIQEGAFSAGKPRMWSQTRVRRDGVRQNFDIASDGKRAVVFPPADDRPDAPLRATFLFNFFDEVRRRVK